MRIYKYPLPIKRKIELVLPEGARVLSVHNQNDVPTLWALVHPIGKLIPRRVFLATTGEDFAPEELHDMEFVGTCHLNGGRFVCHIFVEKEK